MSSRKARELGKPLAFEELRARSARLGSAPDGRPWRRKLSEDALQLPTEEPDGEAAPPASDN